MVDSPLVTTTVSLPAELYEWLRAEAFRRRTTQAQLVRDALEALRRSSK